jgi:hypothetical protein
MTSLLGLFAPFTVQMLFGAIAGLMLAAGALNRKSSLWCMKAFLAILVGALLLAGLAIPGGPVSVAVSLILMGMMTLLLTFVLGLAATLLVRDHVITPRSRRRIAG